MGQRIARALGAFVWLLLFIPLFIVGMAWALVIAINAAMHAATSKGVKDDELPEFRSTNGRPDED